MHHQAVMDTAPRMVTAPATIRPFWKLRSSVVHGLRGAPDMSNSRAIQVAIASSRGEASVQPSDAEAQTQMVQILSSSYVRPACPTDTGKSYTLTALDRFICFAQPFKRILFYKKPSSSVPWQSVVGHLKDSLSDALVLFYPFAARLRPTGCDGQVEVWCNDGGAEFVEAVVAATLEELGELREQELFYLAPGQEQLSAVQPWTSDTPPLSVQVTRFACGGFSVGLACLHQIVDALCFWHFLHSWSLIASNNKARVVEPDYSRHLLRADRDKHYSRLPLEYTVLSRAGVGTGMTVSSELETKVFHFTKQAISEMKQAATESSRDGKQFTTYEVLVGHVWQRIVAARGLSGCEETRFVLPMTVRNRPTGPSPDCSLVHRFKGLPATYFGNAVAYGVVRPVTVQELLSGDAAFCASLVQEAKANYDPETVQCLINVGEGIDASSVPLLRCLLLPHTFIIGDSHSTPAYQTDFGWGTPESVRYADLYNAPNVLLLLAGKQPGSVNIQICSPTHHMKRLEEDTLFRGTPFSCTRQRFLSRPVSSATGNLITDL